MQVVDARGLSCPQPAMMARQAIQTATDNVIEVLVDSGTSRDNVSRLAQRAGWRITVHEQPEGGYRLVLER